MPHPRCWLFHCSRYNEITPIISMGLWGLADFLTRTGFPTQIVHTGIEEAAHGRPFDPGHYIGPDTLLAGFSAHWFPQMPEVIDLAREIKERWPGVFTLAGGYSASYFGAELLREAPWLDAVMCGDAEKPLAQLLQALEQPPEQRCFAGIPNLIWREGAEIRVNPQTYVSTPADVAGTHYARMSEYLHNYAFSDAHGLYDRFTTVAADFAPSDLAVKKTFYLLTGKGCPVNCSICGGGREAQHLLNGRRQCMFLPDEQIVETVRTAMDHGYQNFYVCYDPVPHQPRYYTYLRAIREAGLDIDLSFSFWRLPSPEALAELKAATRHLLVDISPESISEEVRRRNKGFAYSNQELYGAIDLLYREQVYSHVYFCYFLPHETEADVLATREAFWAINVQYPHFIEATYLRISTDPASPLYRHPEQWDCDLLVGSLGEHVAAARQEARANVLVHRIRTIPAERQEELEKRITLDRSLKRVLKYHVKLLARAFPDVAAFVAYLDAFYAHAGLLQAAPVRELAVYPPRELIGQLRAFTSVYLPEHPEVDPYAVDVLTYLLAHVELIDLAAPAVVPGGALPTPRVPALSPAVRAVRLRHDIHGAIEHLVYRKSFPDVTAESTDLLLVRREAGLEVFRTNDTLLEVVSACRENGAENLRETAEEIAGRLAREYTDDPGAAAAIAAEFLQTMAQLAAAGILLEAGQTT